MAKKPPLKGQPARWRREPALWLLPLLFVIFANLYVGAGVLPAEELRIAGIDSAGYYAWIRSLIFDRDFDFENEYRALNPESELVAGTLVDPDGPRTATGRLPNVFAIGAGLFWSPFLAIAHGYALLTDAPADGYSLPYAVAVHIANAFYGLAGALLLYGVLRAWFDGRVATIASVAAWACSSALYYTFAKETMAHACSFFAVSLFLCVWSRARSNHAWPLWWMAVGVALGLAALVRWQNAVFVLIPAIDLVVRERQRAIVPIACLASAAVIVFVPQLIGWRVVFGTSLTIPQGEAFMQWTNPQLLAAFVSRSHGLFLWTPICIVGVAGLFLWKKEWRSFLPALAAVFLIQVYVSAAAGDPGWSFGMRRLVNCVPLLAFGIAAVISAWRVPPKAAWAVVGFLAVWNALFALQFMGYLDPLYVSDALYAQYPAYDAGLVTEDQLQAALSSPGSPFDYEAFKAEHIFPRDAAPTWQQFFSDKLTVLFLLLT